MVSENKWKVILLIFATANAYDRQSRALSLVYPNKPLAPYRNVPMFVSKNLQRKGRSKSRLLFLDEDENKQSFGKGEIDLTLDKNYNSKIKFDDSSDYDFTSPEDEKIFEKDPPSGNERFYDSPRFHASQFNPFIPQAFQGRFAHYAPSYGFNPFSYTPPIHIGPAVRNSFYNGWKARSPRVVFPYQDTTTNAVQTNSHSGPVSDNVVFREQNFGINDVNTDDLALQDLGTSSSDAFTDRDRAHRTQNVKFNTKRMDYKSNDSKEKYQYIPLPNDYDRKPIFIQKNGDKILPPNLEKNFYEFTNVTKEFGQVNAFLPKFKPITDDQMLRINEILKTKSTKLVPEKKQSTKTRRGKMIQSESVENIDNGIEEIIDKNNRKDRQEDKKCAQGGTCEFFFYCWMVGGLLEGSCGSLLKGCCHRVAKAGILGVQDSNGLDYASNEISFGPVINDQSKCSFCNRISKSVFFNACVFVI